MKYQIIGKNIEVTEGIRSAVVKKLSRMNKYFTENDEITCRTVVRSYKVGAKVEITIFTPQMDFRAEVKDDDLYNAVDEAIEKLEHQMSKLKTRMSRRRKEGIADSVLYENILADEKDNENDTVVRLKTVYLKPMTIDEAITRMEAIDHDFFVYLDVEDDCVAVVYRRHDGGYGTLQVENKF